MKTRRFVQERIYFSLFCQTVTYRTSKSGCSTINADRDSDLLIVQTTYSQGKENNILFRAFIPLPSADVAF